VQGVVIAARVSRTFNVQQQQSHIEPAKAASLWTFCWVWDWLIVTSVRWLAPQVHIQRTLPGGSNINK